MERLNFATSDFRLFFLLLVSVEILFFSLSKVLSFTNFFGEKSLFFLTWQSATTELIVCQCLFFPFPFNSMLLSGNDTAESGIASFLQRSVLFFSRHTLKLITLIELLTMKVVIFLLERKASGRLSMVFFQNLISPYPIRLCVAATFEALEVDIVLPLHALSQCSWDVQCDVAFFRPSKNDSWRLRVSLPDYTLEWISFPSHNSWTQLNTVESQPTSSPFLLSSFSNYCVSSLDVFSTKIARKKVTFPHKWVSFLLSLSLLSYYPSLTHLFHHSWWHVFLFSKFHPSPSFFSSRCLSMTEWEGKPPDWNGRRHLVIHLFPQIPFYNFFSTSFWCIKVTECFVLFGNFIRWRCISLIVR